MIVFKRTWQELAKGVLYTLAAGALGFVAGSLLANLAGAPGWTGAALALLLAAAVGLLLLAGEDIRLELEADGTLRMYQMGRLRHTLPLAACGLERARRRNNYVHDFALIVSPPQAGDAPAQKPLRLDCTPLGKAQFERLCGELCRIKGVTL